MEIKVYRSYSILKSLRHELDMFYDLEWSCATDSAQF